MLRAHGWLICYIVDYVSLLQNIHVQQPSSRYTSTAGKISSVSSPTTLSPWERRIHDKSVLPPSVVPNHDWWFWCLRLDFWEDTKGKSRLSTCLPIHFRDAETSWPHGKQKRTIDGRTTSADGCFINQIVQRGSCQKILRRLHHNTATVDSRFLLCVQPLTARATLPKNRYLVSQAR
jgi:hypothetical protein